MKKVRFTISDFMNEIIKSDSEYFKLQIGKIGNIIFNYYIDKNLNKVELENSSGEVIQFNLNKNNEEIFMDTLIRNKVDNGISFCGVRIFKNLMRVKQESLKLSYQKLKIKIKEYKNKKITEKELYQTLNSIFGYWKKFNTKELRIKIIKKLEIV